MLLQSLDKCENASNIPRNAGGNKSFKGKKESKGISFVRGQKTRSFSNERCCRSLSSGCPARERRIN